MRKILFLAVLGLMISLGSKAQMSFNSGIQNDFTSNETISLFGDNYHSSFEPGNLDNQDLNRRRRRGGRGRGGAFGQGVMVFQAGYGFPNMVGALFSTYEIYTGFEVKSMGPIHAEFEYGVGDNIGVGLSINMAFSNVEYETGFTNNDGSPEMAGVDYTAMAFNFRFNHHFINEDQLDVFWGLGAGYGLRSFTYWSDDEDWLAGEISSPIPLGFEITTGLRYYFTDNIGVYAELGLAKAVLQAGVAFKIGG